MCAGTFSVDRSSKQAYINNQQRGTKREPPHKVLGGTNMAEKKMTRAQALTAAIAYAEQDGNAECVDVLNKMLTSITKPRKATTSKTRIQNENLARKVYDMVEGSVTSKDVAALGIAGISSSQKATAVMNVAADLGLFSKAKDSKRLVYTKVDGDSE